MSWYTIVGALEHGLVFALMALGVYLTFRVLDFPDLTVDGSLPLGAAVSASIIAAGGNPFVSVIAAFASGALAGAFTGIISTKLRILNLLAGILTMIALYSINIRIMGAPNLTLLNRPSVFDAFQGLGIPSFIVPMAVSLLVLVLVLIALDLFLNTNFGLALRATGDNPTMVHGSRGEYPYGNHCGSSYLQRIGGPFRCLDGPEPGECGCGNGCGNNYRGVGFRHYWRSLYWGTVGHRRNTGSDFGFGSSIDSPSPAP